MEASGRAELSCPWVLRLWLIVQGQRGQSPCGAGEQAGAGVSSDAHQAGVQVTTCLIMQVQVEACSRVLGRPGPAAGLAGRAVKGPFSK